MAKLRYALGIVVNPRTTEPFQVTVDDGNEIDIWSLDDEAYGTGYFDRSGIDEYGRTCLLTGCVRCHTPQGVKRKGRGDGTALYTALCMAADLQVSEGIGIRFPDCAMERGISSASPRSSQADRWWGLATGKYGLADRTAYENEVEVEDDVDGSGGDYVGSSLADLTGIDVSRWTASVSGTRSEPIDVDTYMYKEAVKASLIGLSCVENPRDGSFAELVFTGRPEIHPEVLVAAKPVVEKSRDGRKRIEKYIEIAAAGGADKEMVDDMVLRWLSGSERVEALDYGGYAQLAGIGERAERTNGRRVRTNGRRPVGRRRYRNDAREAAEMRVENLREQLGWGRFQMRKAP